VKSYLVKLFGHEEGPYGEPQIAQMFADGRIDRNTPCKPADRGDWKTIDDYLPMLKYGTQLPAPSQIPSTPPNPPPTPASSAQRVAVVDFDIPFGSVLKIMFKWMAAAFIVFCCFMPLIIVIWLIIMAIFAGLINGAMSNLHQP
jgi:GYF domain 2